MIRALASRTGTQVNLAALRAAGWGLFVSALGVHSHEGFPFWIESAAWSFRQLGLDWHPGPVRIVDGQGRARTLKGYNALLETHGRDPLCEAIIAPDIVGGGMESLALSLSWLPRLLTYGPRVYIPVQPGVDPRQLDGVIGDRVAVFVGGDDAWKEETAAFWARFAHERGALCHVGRVNTLRRLVICQAAGVDSIDGSGASRFVKHLAFMENARAVPVQVGLVLVFRADIIGADDEGDWCILVQVDMAFTVDAILLAALAARAIDLEDASAAIEVTTDYGSYRKREAGWTWATWHMLDAECLAEDPTADVG